MAENENPQDTSIVPTGGAGSGASLDPLAIIEQRNKLLDRIVDAAIRSTHPGQWLSIGDKPYPTGPAVEAMARRCAVGMDSLSREKIQSYDDEGEFYIWVYRARFYLPGGQDGSRDVIWAEGTCSSRDSFLGTETSEGRELSEIDEGSIMKAALTNCRNNGVTQLLAVRNMTWERLGKLGITRDGIGKVDFQHGAKGGGRGKVESEKPIPFGKNKGKTVGDPEVTDSDLAWLLGKMKEPASDPKFQKSNDEWVKRLEAEQARRANAKAGTTPAASSPAPTIYQRILALPEANGMPEEDVRAVIKAVTKKDSSAALAETDIAAVQVALAKGEWDVKF